MTGPRLSIIPARAATDPALKPRDLQVLCVLGRHTDDLGWCSKSQVKMAKEMGCARSTVFEAIERLMEAGYLERYEQPQENGRDCPHLYRVILDPRHPDPAAIAADVDEDEDPADQSAPPAGISAPPAGPGPAPKNDPLRTVERERACEVPEEGEKPEGLTKRAEALFFRSFKGWDRFDVSPKAPMLAAWAKLPWSDMEACAPTVPVFLAANRKAGVKQACAISTFLDERMWVAFLGRLGDGQEKPTVVETSPFSKPWMARRFELLLGGAVAIAERLTSFEQTLVEQGKADAEDLRRDRRARSGYPMVNAMQDNARFGKGVTVTAALAAIAVEFVALWPGTEDLAEWEVEHQVRGWPWLGEFKADKPLFFPPGGPEEGLRWLADKLVEITQHRQAAE